MRPAGRRSAAIAPASAVTEAVVGEAVASESVAKEPEGANAQAEPKLRPPSIADHRFENM
ncbi:MAG TPA: hypothetical protein VFU74_16005 [Actinocrinis sp.]|nr:hypothetical protein [Actinocrinis sp.]